MLAVVSIDPGAYEGSYNVQGQTSFDTGPQTADLNPGRYTINIANTYNFTFDVDAGGQVTSNNTGAAERDATDASKLKFHTTTITIDPGSFPGIYDLANVTTYATGIQNITVVPASRYISNIAGTGNLIIDVDASGQVTSHNTAAAMRDAVDASKLNFNTTTIAIDPGMYTGVYRTNTSAFVNGVQSFDVLPTIAYIVNVQNTSFVIDVDASGQVSSKNAGVAVRDATSSSKLNFNTTTITIDPKAYTGNYRVGDISGFVSGAQTVLTVVPNLKHYSIQIQHTGFSFNVDASGQVTSNNTVAAVRDPVDSSKLNFNTTTITIDPGAYTGQYAVTSGLVSGVQPFYVVPNLRNYLASVGFTTSFLFEGVARRVRCASDRWRGSPHHSNDFQWRVLSV